MDTDPRLQAIDQDLRDVEIALGRLDDGTYWTDEHTGEPLDESLLAENPLLRTTPSEAPAPDHSISAQPTPAHPGSHQVGW